jgi:YD repeat-containing protein
MTTSITDPNNNTTAFLYENAGKPAELTKIINPLNNTFLTSYDSFGRVSQVTDADGNPPYTHMI